MQDEERVEDLKLIYLNLPCATIAKLQKIKVKTWKQLQLRRPIAIRVLSFKLVVEIEERCQSLFQKGPGCLTSGTMLWDKLTTQPKITSFSKQIDDAICGGFQKEKLLQVIEGSTIYELVGAPGTGKSQLCYQLASSAFVPRCLQGVAARRVVLIDSECSLQKDRLNDILEGTVAHCKSLQPELKKCSNFCTKDLLRKVSAYRCFRAPELLSILDSLLTLSKADPGNCTVDLLIIDSVATPFRLPDFESVKERCDMLNKLARLLNEFVVVSDTCVVLTNHITTKVVESGGGTGSAALGNYFVPLLGDLWGTLAKTRILLSENAVQREFSVFKSSNEVEPMPAPFQITKGGIRDICCPNQK